AKRVIAADRVRRRLYRDVRLARVFVRLLSGLPFEEVINALGPARKSRSVICLAIERLNRQPGKPRLIGHRRAVTLLCIAIRSTKALLGVVSSNARINASRSSRRSTVPSRRRIVSRAATVQCATRKSVALTP